MNQDKIDRMAGLTNIFREKELGEAVETIALDLREEGFDYEDIVDYLKLMVKEKIDSAYEGGGYDKE